MIVEFVGYCARASAHNKTGKLMPYIFQNFFILVAPALFAASIYMTLGRIIRSVKGEKLSLVRVDRLTKTFVIGDIMSFLIQSGSAGLMFSSSTVNIGQAMVVGGLFIQIIMFGLFALTAVIFQVSHGHCLASFTIPDALQMRLNRHPTIESFNPENPRKESLHMLYGVSGLIMIRSIFRVVEYLMGNDGYPLSHEWTLYIFDSVLMLLVTVIFYIRYPSKLQQAIGANENNGMISRSDDGKL